MKILIVGTVAFDAIETPFGKKDKIIGGAATYISLSASFFEQNIGLVSIIGSDFPVDVIDDLQSRGINTEGLEIVEGAKSFFWSGIYFSDLNTRETLATKLNVLLDFNPKVPQSFKDAEIIMLGNLTPSVQLDVINQCTNKNAFIVLDTMNFWMTTQLEDLKNVISKVNLLTINDEEARLLTGEYSLVKASKKILSMGPQYLVIKKGEHGALLFSNTDVFFVPALPLEDVYNPTGAGDTFAGGMIGYLACCSEVNFRNLKKSIVFGSTMASFCVEKFGTEKLFELTNDEIDFRLKKFWNLTNFSLD